LHLGDFEQADGQFFNRPVRRRTMSTPNGAEMCRAVLEDFERDLDPGAPTARGGVRVIGYGEVSAALLLEALPGQVCKRMAGLRDRGAVERYQRLIDEYVALLRRSGLEVVDTRVVTVEIRGRRPVAYLLQQHLPAGGLGNTLLREADDATLLACVDRVLAALFEVWKANRERDGGLELAVDAQLSNWHFQICDGAVGPPTLFDVGTPYVRRGTTYQIDLEIFLAAVPPLIRGHYRRARAVENYLDHYFDPRSVALDLLGNFHKEGRPDRVPAAAARVNAWLTAHADEFGHPAAIDSGDVARFYAADAAQLELFLKVRRFDRFVRTHLLHDRYDFILPGAIRR